MRQKFFKYLAYTLAGSAVLLIIAATLGFIDPYSFIAIMHHHGAWAMAAPAAATVEGIVTTDDTTTYQQPSIDKNLSLMQPDKFPFDTILRQMAYTKKITNWKTEYYAVDVRAITDTLSVAVSASGTSSAAWATFNITPTSLFMWSVDDNILVNGINGNDSKELVLHIVAITATQLTVEAVNGIGDNNADLPAIAQNTQLTRIGNAKEEKASQTTPFTTIPQEAYNYAQIHMAQVEQSLYDKLSTKWVQWNLNDMRSAALWDMRGQMEFASLFGVRNKVYDSVSKTNKYMSGGALRFIDKIIPKTISTFDNAGFDDIAKQLFTGNNGSVERVIFPGSGALSVMATAPTFVKQIEAQKTEVVWGVRFNRIETNYGIMLVHHHPGLDYTGWTNNAFIFDMSNVEKHVFKDIETRSIDFDASGQRKTNADIIDEAFCPVFKNVDTHAILKFS